MIFYKYFILEVYYEVAFPKAKGSTDRIMKHHY